MDNLGNEVTSKVREAIRTKLKEMKANSSNEIIDYIMLLVTTKKSSAELTKSIDFLMENNTNVFVKWLSAIIKKLQQVTVSTKDKDISENLEVANKSPINDENHQNDDILICVTDDVKFDDSEEEKEHLIDLNEENVQTLNGKKEKCSPESSVTKGDEDQICLTSDKSNKQKEKKFSPTKTSTTKPNVQINRQNVVEKSSLEIKNGSKVVTDSSTVPKESISDVKDDGNCKRKRPRITINSDDEDEKNVCSVRRLITIKEPVQQLKNELPKQSVNRSMSKVVVVRPPKSKKEIDEEAKKKLFMHDLVVQRVDHQRGALALDTAFNYIQQQIGASDKDISVIKKWRDHALGMLRTSKK